MTGPEPPRVRRGVQEAYDGSAVAWRAGPHAVYARLAEALVERAPVPLAGATVLDVGAGTAVAATAALARGATLAVATDVSAAMLAGRPAAVPAALADVAQLPFADGAFDVVTAAFCLGHLPDPAAGVREIRRVGGALVASAFVPGPAHPVKTLVDEVFVGAGFTVPRWYQHQKETLEPVVDDPDALADLAVAGGFGRVEVDRVEVDLGLDTPAQAVDWRLGMAHLAPFVASLEPDALAAARATAEQAVAGHLPVVLPILVLSAA